MNQQEAEEYLRSLTVDPGAMSKEEFKEKTELILPRLLNLSGLEDPVYQTQNSSCFDIRASQDVVLIPGQTTIVSTGLFLTMEGAALSLQLNPTIMNVVLHLRTRSSLAVQGVILGGGEIDRDYLYENNVSNEIKVILHLLGTNGSATIPIKRGDRIAQARWDLIIRDPFVQVNNVVRSGGIGSTGK